MEIHQTTFVQAVALAGAVALLMTGWDRAREEVRVLPASVITPTATTSQGSSKAHR
ncbi:MAG TPA: hypothetical protein VIW78_08650 [Burkholderiales bacterium]